MALPQFGLKPLPTMVGPGRVVYTIHDLPPPGDTRRWGRKEKNIVITAVAKQLLTFDEALARYRIPADELQSWRKFAKPADIAKAEEEGLLPPLSAQKPLAPPAKATGVAVFGDLEVDFDAKKIFVRTQPLRLQGLGYRIVEFMAMYPGAVITKKRNNRRLFIFKNYFFSPAKLSAMRISLGSNSEMEKG